MQPIETQYAGCRFRSRTEARWAVFFDALGITWDYELEGFKTQGTYYLPDFWLPDAKVWVEIKGGSRFGVLTPDESEKMWPFACQAWTRGERTRVLWAIPRMLAEHHKLGRELQVAGISCMSLTDARPPLTVVSQESCPGEGIDLLGVKEPESVVVPVPFDPQMFDPVIPGETKGRAAWALVLWTTGNSWQEMTDALAAARSARFEHGEVTAPRRVTAPEDPHPRRPDCDPAEIIPAGMTGLEGTPEAFGRWQADVGFSLPEGFTAARDGSQIRFFGGFPEDKIVVEMLRKFGITVLRAGTHVPGIDFTGHRRDGS